MAEQTYFASSTASAVSASKRHFTLYNPSNSGKLLKLYKVYASGWPIAAVAGMVVTLSCHRFSGAAPTGGTAVAVVARSLVDPNPPAGIEARIGPTGFTATEEAVAFGSGAISSEETSSGNNKTSLYEFTIDGLKPLEVPQGYGISIKQGALASAGAVTIECVFTLVTSTGLLQLQESTGRVFANKHEIPDNVNPDDLVPVKNHVNPGWEKLYKSEKKAWAQFHKRVFEDGETIA